MVNTPSATTAFVGVLWDVIYNAACEMAGVEIHKHTFFEYRAMVTQDRTHSSLKAMVGQVTDHSMWKALQRRESDGVVLVTIPLLKELFPRLLAKVPTLVANMEDAVSKGYSPLYAITSHFSSLTVVTKTKRRAAEAPPIKVPPAKKQLSTCQSTYLKSDKHRASIDKGNTTKKGMLKSKYQWARIPFSAYLPTGESVLSRRKQPKHFPESIESLAGTMPVRADD